MENFTKYSNDIIDKCRYKIGKVWMLVTSFFLVSFISSEAQTNISGVINTYAPVSAVSVNNVTVGTSTGASHTWTVGDYVLIIQMTGNTNVNAGHYDSRKIVAVSGSTITLNGTSLAGRYDPATEKVQLIYIPYSATGFTVTGVVTPLVWNGSTGGVVTLYTPGTLTMNANINASCSGFRSVEPQLLTGNNIYYGGAGANGLWAGGASGGSYGVGGYIGGVRATTFINVATNGTYNGGTGGVDDTVPYRMGGGGGGAGAGGGGGGGAGGDHAGAGGGGASPTTAGCGGRGTENGTGGTGSINGLGGTNGSFINSGGGGSYPAGGGGGGSKYASGGGGAASTSTAFGFGYAGINGGAGATSNNNFSGGGGAGGVGTMPTTGGAAYSLPTNNYDNFLNTTNPRVQMGGGTQGTIVTQGVSGGGIVILEANNIVGNNSSILANGCAGLMSPSQSIPSSGGGGGGTIVVNANSFTSPTTIAATGGNGGNGVGTTDGSGNEASGGSGGGGGGAIWVKSTTPANNLNPTVSLPSVNNVTFNINGGTSGIGGLALKTGNLVSSGGCGGAGIVYASSFGLFCEAGAIAPTLSKNTQTNVCPATTASLTGLVTNTCPTLSNLEWHTVNTGLSAANKVATPAAVTANTYYPVCYDGTNDCYSPVGSGVVVTIGACCNAGSSAPSLIKD